MERHSREEIERLRLEARILRNELALQKLESSLDEDERDNDDPLERLRALTTPDLERLRHLTTPNLEPLRRLTDPRRWHH